jgi:hypothetical protein
MLLVFIQQFDAQGNYYLTYLQAIKLHLFLFRKLSTFAFCRDRMLDSMCLLSICKQLFAEKVPLRKEAMKAVLEWNIDSSDRSRSQVRTFFLSIKLKVLFLVT